MLVDLQRVPVRPLYALVALVGLLFSIPAAAQDDVEIPWYEQRRGELRVGWFFVSSTDTSILLESNSNPLAATVNFQRDLGLDSRASVGRVRFGYNFSPRHRFDLSYVGIDREGERIVFDREINIGDITIPIGASVVSNFDTQIIKLAYTNLFYRSEKVRLGFSAGINFSEFDMGARFETTPISGGTTTRGEERAKGSGPLPVIGGRISYSISEKWFAIASADIFALSVGDYDGTLIDFEFMIENRVSRRFGWGTGLELLAFDLTAVDDDLTGNFQTSSRGINLYASFYF